MTVKYQYDRTLTCPTCGFQMTARVPGGPMGRHMARCPSTIEELAAMCGVPQSTIDSPDACWVPTTTHRGTRRAKVSGPNGTVRAHVRAFELYNGRPPQAGFIIMHRCDTMNCVNPRHFREGTQADNIRDMHMKGRSRDSDSAR